MIYNWNISEWKKLILPTRLVAQLRWNDMLLSMLEAVKSGYDLFMIFRNAILYKLQWTSQTIWLERLLNDRFNNGNPAFGNFDFRAYPVGIYIADPSNYKEGFFRWNISEQRHQAARYMRTELAGMAANDPRRKYRFNNSELEANNDFVVKVPLSLFDVSDPAHTGLLANMKAWIERYRIAGSRYTIVNY
jgi:hypothetical protein